MLRGGIGSSKRLMATVAESTASVSVKPVDKTWAKPSNLENEPRAFKTSSKYRSSLLNGVSKEGPPSLSSRKFKMGYNSPPGLQDAFDVSYAYLRDKSQELYNKIESSNENKTQLEVEAQINNPEVRFNFAYYNKLENNPQYIDYTQPVYRELLKQEWESKDQMLLMQRLEQLHAIPDTLPTFEPRVPVSLKFLNHTTVNRWVEPGTVLSSNVTTYPPSIKIQELDQVDTKTQLYTVLIVNPDVADIANNTYKTQISWGLSNVKLDYNDNFITPRRLLEDDGSINEIIEYQPPVPEKNLPAQRFIVWVFRQPSPINVKLSNRDFNIREFVKVNSLDAVGAHMWRSTWDLNVSKVRELYGLPKGTVFHKVRSDKRMK